MALRVGDFRGSGYPTMAAEPPSPPWIYPFANHSSRISASFGANDNRLITCGGIVLELYRYAVLFVFLLVPALQFAETEVSRADHIDGMEVPALHAHKVLPPTSPVITRAAIYVEKTNRGMYFHSNFISRAP